MTYCLAIRVDAGIIFAADTRTNAGVDYVTSYRKLRVFQPGPDRSFVLLAAGSLATTRELVDQMNRDLETGQSGESLNTVSYMFEAATYVGRLSREIQERHGPALARSGVSGDVTLILGGQIRGHMPELMLIYPQGNYIAATRETPYLQIGETKYGKPVLDRIVNYGLSLEDTAKLALVSLDATVRSNITVGLPFDFAAYRNNSFLADQQVRIEADSPYYRQLREQWQQGFTSMFSRAPAFPMNGMQAAPVQAALPGPITVGHDPTNR